MARWAAGHHQGRVTEKSVKSADAVWVLVCSSSTLIAMLAGLTTVARVVVKTTLPSNVAVTLVPRKASAIA
jgi:hypothetical protein